MNTLTVANWKMHGNRQEWQGLARQISEASASIQTQIVLAVPAPAFFDVSECVKNDSNVSLAAQDIHPKDEGAHTGNISASMLQSFSGTYTLVGHSERRLEHAEKGILLNKKMKQALAHHIHPIFCFGESLEDRKSNKTIERLDEQLQEGLNGIVISSADDLSLAYEPVWAISSSAGSLGREPSEQELEEVFCFLRSAVNKRFGEEVGKKIKLLYGGSVKPENTEKIMKNHNISGVLVGGASLKADVFMEIAEKVATSGL